MHNTRGQVLRFAMTFKTSSQNTRGQVLRFAMAFKSSSPQSFYQNIALWCHAAAVLAL